MPASGFGVTGPQEKPIKHAANSVNLIVLLQQGPVKSGFTQNLANANPRESIWAQLKEWGRGVV
jgi:hypothetical protein